MVTAVDHQAAQATLVSALVDRIAVIWPQLDVKNLRDSLPIFSSLIAALVQQYGRASATLAAHYYMAERAAAGVKQPFSVAPASPADLLQVDRGVRWATKGLWTSETPDTDAAQTLVTGVAETFVLDTSRATILDAVKADRKAKAWARVVEPGACSFCLLLATRGEVYRSDRSASFEAHDHCRCHAEPVFTAYEPTAEIRRAQQIYRSVKGTRGGPAAVRNAFRQAIEADRKPMAPGAPRNDPGGHLAHPELSPSHHA